MNWLDRAIGAVAPGAAGPVVPGSVARPGPSARDQRHDLTDRRSWDSEWGSNAGNMPV